MTECTSKVDFLKISKCKKLADLKKEMSITLSKTIKSNPLSANCTLCSDSLKFQSGSSKKLPISTVYYKDVHNMIECESLKSMVFAIRDKKSSLHTFICGVRFGKKDDYNTVFRKIKETIGQNTGTGTVGAIKQRSEQYSGSDADNRKKGAPESIVSNSSSKSDENTECSHSAITDSEENSNSMSTLKEGRISNMASGDSRHSSQSHKIETTSVEDSDVFSNIIYIDQAIIDLFNPFKHRWISDEQIEDNSSRLIGGNRSLLEQEAIDKDDRGSFRMNAPAM